MSFQAMAKAVEIKLPTQEKFVLIMLANYADESGKCWPSVETLCQDTGMSRAAVHKALAKLTKRGLLSRAKRFKNNLQTTSVYSLKWG
jgi:DNA-binding IclR family transcriptional regulator